MAKSNGSTKTTAAAASLPYSTGYDPRDEKPAEKGNGLGFVTIKDGESKELVPLVNKEDIIRYQQVGIWSKDKKNNISWPYSGDADPMHDLGLTKSYRAILPVLEVDSETGESEVKAWGISKTVHTALLEIADEHGQLRGLPIKVRRTGEALQTKYNLTPRAKRKNVDDVAEPDVIPLIGPLTLEEARAAIAKKFGKESYEQFLSDFRGKGKTGPRTNTTDDDEDEEEGDDKLSLDDLELK